MGLNGSSWPGPCRLAVHSHSIGGQSIRKVNEHAAVVEFHPYRK